MIYRFASLVLLIGLTALSAAAQTPVPALNALSGKVSAALEPGDADGLRLAMRVVDALTGEVLLETGTADQAFIPASNMKLVTSATCLDLYGPDYGLTTTLALRGDDLWIIGTGDPALGDPSLEEDRGRNTMSVLDDWVRALKQRGVSSIEGDLVVCDPVFDNQFTHPKWHPGNLLYWYGAPVAGVNFNDNCIDVTFVPSEQGKPASLEVIPPAGGFQIRGEALSAEEHAPQLAKLPNTPKPVYKVSGTVGRRGGPYSKPVNNPRLFLGEALKAHLQANGIAVAGQVRVSTDSAPAIAESETVAVFTTPLTDVLGRVNTNSQNMMAEALAKLSGLAHDRAQGVADPRGSWASGHEAAVAFLSDAGVDPSTLVADDGSGLSHHNRLSAELVTDLLLHMLNEHEHGEHFVNSMAISGVRGSVRNRMKDITGRVYAKTGTISRVSALSGIVFAENGRVAVFSILHNGFEGSQTPYRKQQDDAVLALYEWLENQGPPSKTVEPSAQREDALELIGIE